jgi:hypothetical protein
VCAGLNILEGQRLHQETLQNWKRTYDVQQEPSKRLKTETFLELYIYIYIYIYIRGHAVA